MDGSMPMFRLTKRGGDGLCCDARGVALGPVALVDAAAANGRRVYRVRPAEEVARALALALHPLHVRRSRALPLRTRRGGTRARNRRHGESDGCHGAAQTAAAFARGCGKARARSDAQKIQPRPAARPEGARHGRPNSCQSPNDQLRAPGGRQAMTRHDWLSRCPRGPDSLVCAQHQSAQHRGSFIITAGAAVLCLFLTFGARAEQPPAGDSPAEPQSRYGHVKLATCRDMEVARGYLGDR
jgi:hypothetical protein